MKLTVLALTLCMAMTLTAISALQAEEKHFMGEITKIAADSVTINKTIVFQVTGETTIVKGKGTAKFRDLRTGDRVAIHAKETDGKLNAIMIQLGDAPAEEHRH